MTEKAESTELVREANKTVFETEQLASVDSFDNAVALLAESGIVAETIDDYGTGFTVLEDKDLLIKRPFVCVEWRFNPSEKYGSEFVSVTLVTKAGEKYIVNDGSTGICKQLRDVTDARLRNRKGFPQQGLVCPKGLRKSEYVVKLTNPNTGAVEDSAATTYYLA